MKRLLSAVFIFAAGMATAEDFAANDVSILLEAPLLSSDARVALPEVIFPSALSAGAGAVVAAVNGMPTAVEQIDASLFTERRDQLHVSSIRIDPGAPGLHSNFGPLGRNLQIRLVAQPVTFQGDKARIADEAIHLVYTFGENPAAETPVCRFRVLPEQSDIDAFKAALDALADIRDELAGVGVDTAGKPLGVHPAFGQPDAAQLMATRLSTFLTTHLKPERLSAVSIAGIPPGAPEPWVFLALQKQGDKLLPVPGPAIAQSATDPKQGNFQQMLSFAFKRDGEVVPPGVTRNNLPVDCLANFMFPPVGLPQPDAGQGVSTSVLFGPGANTPERASVIGNVIADPAVSHFFNTDCVSCHTETRREIDAGPDEVAVAARIAADEQIAVDDLPRSPDGMDSTLDHWNVRAFGWFPGFPQTNGRAHATVVRRTARETAEVVACLNEGDWTKLDQPCLSEDHTQYMDQGWSHDIRRLYYHTSQGGEIMPLTWFLALRAHDADVPFSAPSNLGRYGLLPSPTDGHNPHGLPVGFATTQTDRGLQVSLNCAVCHSADVGINGEFFRVDGAPSSFDFDSFGQDLARVVRDTGQMRPGPDGDFVPTDGFLAFMGRLALIDPAEMSDPAAFTAKYLSFASEFSGQMAQRSPLHPSGPGRVDALTQIVNAVAVKDLGEAGNLATPRAPTSYPSLWMAEDLEFVQWNLAVADPFSRNLGQALGVFGSVKLSGPDLFKSSADTEALEDYERWITDLTPPAWPEDLLGPIDVTLAEQGRDLFAASCEGCHNAPPYRTTDPDENLRGDQFIRVKPVPAAVVGTDGEYTRAFTGRWAKTRTLSTEADLPSVVPSVRLLQTVVGSVVRKALGAEAGAKMRLRPADHSDCAVTEGTPRPCAYKPPMLGAALKAGPLVGIWATGPYLHNGSVRTVYQVISPPDTREPVFFVGDRRLDAKRMGFASTKTDDAYRFDTSIPGNGNGGHVFWDTPFTHDEKMAIIEYLKDPDRFPIDRQ
ncbi:Cytochrome c [Falsiruegeria litorea R37]|uniref:Cytochrome c n=1 Tax=Falsiruegeria litorea R37 TaxID=1200284 RepID=A0A1Y5RKL5_9RHOB|nr:di-heme-cytochrome C peroxidase [Falsiruegeria litorea]SLN19405.1 Cytochrome c [Falsiruegeria litorea R37]